MARLICLLLLACGCAATTAAPSRPQAGPEPERDIAIPEPPVEAPVQELKAAYYRQALPSAVQLVAKQIPRQMLTPLGHREETYVEARDQSGAIAGWLQEFKPEEGVSALLVFRPNFELATVLAAGPLHKRDGKALTPAEMEQLTSIARQPAKEIITSTPAALADANGRTLPAFEGMVVPDAAPLSGLVATLVADTRRILREAPAEWDRKRLAQIFEAGGTDRAVARALAAFLPTTASLDVRRQVYQTMTEAYIAALKAGAAQDDGVEARLLFPALEASSQRAEQATACYRLASEGVRVPLAERCHTALSSIPATPAHAAIMARLQGTLLFLRGDRKGAAAPLAQGAAGIELRRDPELYLRLVEALAADARGQEACPIAKQLFREEPMLPGAKTALHVCLPHGGPVTPVLNAILSEERVAFLGTRRGGDTKVPELNLEELSFEQVDLDLAKQGKITVLVFFSTWCPHCAMELPRVNVFAHTAATLPALRDRVQVIGVRTAVDRERVPIDTFLKQLQPCFRILTDPVMSLVFGAFARAHDLRPALPTLAVVDAQGVTRFLLESGEYRDTARELMWAVEALLGDSAGR